MKSPVTINFSRLIISIFFSITSVACLAGREKNDCELLPHEPSFQVGRSAFWAQEFTGADLAREELKMINPNSLPGNLLGIWDVNDHGEFVSNLISGPFPSATIFQDAPLKYTEISLVESDQVNIYQNEVTNCRTRKTCPYYINQSLTWPSDPQMVKVIKNFKETVIVTSAGNSALFMDDGKRQLSNKNIITVGSIEPDGFASDFTSFAPELTISAPSGDALTSYYNNSFPEKFGGTSGATPQVTGALAAFTLVTGYALNASEAVTLLKNTALSFPHYTSAKNLGAGILNTYKITKLAQQIRSTCSSKENVRGCVKAALTHITSQTVKAEVLDMETVSNLFPTCFERSGPLRKQSCELKKEYFSKLRKFALLEPGNSLPWKILGCISLEEGLNVNASFYSSMGARAESDGKILANKLLEAGKVEDALKYFSSTERSIFKKSDLLNVLKSKVTESPQALAEYVENIPDLILLLIKEVGMDLEVSKFLVENDVLSTHVPIMEALVKRAKADEILEEVISKEEWQKSIRREYNLKTSKVITLDTVRHRIGRRIDPRSFQQTVRRRAD